MDDELQDAIPHHDLCLTRSSQVAAPSGRTGSARAAAFLSCVGEEAWTSAILRVMATDARDENEDEETVDLTTPYLRLNRDLLGGKGFRDLMGPPVEPVTFSLPTPPDYASLVEELDFTPDDSPQRTAEAAEATAGYLSELAKVMEQTLAVNQEVAQANARMLDLTTRAHAAAEVAEAHTRRVANVSVWIAAASLAAAIASIVIALTQT